MLRQAQHNHPSSFFYLGTSLFSFLRFSRTPFHCYKQRFSGHTTLNRRVKMWMLIVLPFAFLFGSAALRVFLFGGEAFGIPITGLLRG